MTSLILVGVGIAGTAILVRAVVGGIKHLPKQMPSGAVLTSYYKGGFDPKMSRREAGLILGISPSSSKEKIGQTHKKIMLFNHPDRGGSPYMAAKINQAKDYLESGGKSD